MRQTLAASTVLLFVICYGVEKDAAADCSSIANALSRATCDCPNDRTCHDRTCHDGTLNDPPGTVDEGSDSMSVTSYTETNNDCRVQVVADWGCTTNAASLIRSPHPDPIDGNPLEFCGPQNDQDCTGTNWHANGPIADSNCNGEEGYILGIVLDENCGSCQSGASMLEVGVNCLQL